MLYAVPANSQELGRLFFTPQQREDMDRRRSSNAQTVVVTPEDLVTVNGKVSRSSGKTTAWINGVPQEDVYKGADASQITIKQGDETPASLRVGETLDRVKGETRDGLDGGRITVQRSRR